MRLNIDNILARAFERYYRTYLNQALFGNSWFTQPVIPVSAERYDQFRGLYPMIYPEAADLPGHYCERCPSDGPCPADTGRLRKGQ